MTYETVATISQLLSLFMFIGMFLGVLVYAFWPSNGERFEVAQERALGLDSESRRRSNRGQS